MRGGAWLDTDEGRRLKIAWQSPGSRQYLLLDQRGATAAVVSSAELARELLAGKAKVVHLSTKPFFERALESIYQQLTGHVAIRDRGRREQ